VYIIVDLYNTNKTNTNNMYDSICQQDLSPLQHNIERKPLTTYVIFMRLKFQI